MEQIKNFSLFIVVGIIVNLIIGWLKSDFISTFLTENLITLLIALVAINTTTMSVVMTKLKELTKKQDGKFTRTLKEMKISIVEQVFLIVITVFVQIVSSSKLVQTSLPDLLFFTDIILIGVFSYAIYILYDTANSIFVILNYEKNEKD
jgi:hypothetical protein